MLVGSSTSSRSNNSDDDPGFGRMSKPIDVRRQELMEKDIGMVMSTRQRSREGGMEEGGRSDRVRT